MNDFEGLPSHNPIDRNALNAQGIAPVNYGPDQNSLIVLFYPKAVLNPLKSQEQGKPVYENKDYVKIQQPGEKLMAIDRPATQDDTRRFSNYWAAYLQKRAQVPEGVPLDLLFPNQPNIPMTLKQFNIHTVEQLSNLSGDALNHVGMGGLDWQEKAKKYLAHAKRGVPHHEFEKKVADLTQQNGLLLQQVQALTARVDEMLVASGERVATRPAPASMTHRQEMPDLSKFDPQTSFINNRMSAETPPAKRGGRPKGSKNKPKETTQ